MNDKPIPLLLQELESLRIDAQWLRCARRTGRHLRHGVKVRKTNPPATPYFLSEAISALSPRSDRGSVLKEPRRCNMPVPATLGPRAESGRLLTSAILRASVSNLCTDARQPRRCRDKPAV